MDYQKLSKEIAESFKDLILTFSDDNDYKEDFIRKEIENYGCDFDKPDIKLANSAIRCAMDYCGLDFSMVRWIMLKPKDYAMPFEPLSEQEILMFTDPTGSKVYDPYFYEHEGKEYITFSTIEAVHSNGIVRSTHEYNLRYSVTDNEWYGDVVRHGDWEDLDSKEALDTAKEYGLDFIAQEVVRENGGSYGKKVPPASLESESHEAISASEEIRTENSYRKQNPQVR